MANRTGKGCFTPGNPGGPGRPRRAVEKEYLDAVLAGVPLEDWTQIVRKGVADAKDGDARAREWLSRSLIGADPIPVQAQVDELRAAGERLTHGDGSTEAGDTGSNTPFAEVASNALLDPAGDGALAFPVRCPRHAQFLTAFAGSLVPKNVRAASNEVDPVPGDGAEVSASRNRARNGRPSPRRFYPS
jgi:hypothetical protein